MKQLFEHKPFDNAVSNI